MAGSCPDYQGGERRLKGIGLVEVLWKAVTSLLNCQLTAAIKFYDVMHKFWEGRLTGTLVLEANLLQHLRAIREAVIFEVFLDLQKAYDALYWERCLKILAAYGFGPRTLLLFQKYWYHMTMLARAGGYFGLPFKVYHRVTQVDPLSSTLFNMVRHLPIGYGGGDNQLGQGGNWLVDTVLGGIFLC